MTFKYPVDPDDYKRGDTIPPQEIRRIMHIPADVPADSEEFRFRALDLRQFLQNSKPGVSIVIHKGSIRILHDGEDQNNYVVSSKRKAMRMFKRRHVEDMATDSSLLSQREQEKRDRRLQIGAFILSVSRKKAIPESLRTKRID